MSSRSVEKDILIARLNRLGIFETSQGRSLSSLTYHALLSLASIEEAVRS